MSYCYTLKIRWARYEIIEGTDGETTQDESTLFIPAKTVTVHAYIPAGERTETMKAWDANGAGYFNYLTSVDKGDVGGEEGGRLIHVVNPDGKDEWYLASHAWLLGASGDTIERLAP